MEIVSEEREGMFLIKTALTQVFLYRLAYFFLIGPTSGIRVATSALFCF